MTEKAEMMESDGHLPSPAGAGRPVRTYLVHRSKLLLEVLGQSLAGCRGIDLVTTSDDYGEVPHRIRETPVDVVLIDASLSRGETRRTIREVKASRPEVAVLPLGLDDEAEILRFVEAGAGGYLSRDASFETLLETLVGIHRGRVPCSHRIAAAALARLREKSRGECRWKREEPIDPPADARLTPRELEVLGLVATGLRNKEIARRLEITLPTVKNHVHKILEKLQVRRRREAIQKAYERGLLLDPLP